MLSSQSKTAGTKYFRQKSEAAVVF